MAKHAVLPRQQSAPPLILALTLLIYLIECSLQESTLETVPTPSIAEEDCFLDDRCTLLIFKNGLPNQGEPNLSSWNEIDVMKWKGVTWTRRSNGTMFAKKLELRNWGLGGAKIYPLLQRGLRLLRVLDISGNYFTGTLPTMLHICSSLQVLDLSNNSFTGELPLQLSCGRFQPSPGNLAPSPNVLTIGAGIRAGMYPNLEIFNLSTNHFTGVLPRNLLVTISSIQHLDVSGNNLTGSIPAQVRNLTNLKSLTLQQNQFTGLLPTFSENCTDLLELKLSSNNFTGTIPFHVLANLPRLEVLEIAENQLHGTLDVGGGGFKFLTMLDVGNNNLGGFIPAAIGNLSRLQDLILKYNFFSGTIPATLRGCSRLRSLRLQYNELNGTIPFELSQLSNLSRLSLDHNKLSGQLPSTLGNCSMLRILWLNGNYFFGSIPPQLGNLTKLSVLIVSANYFNSSIPSEIGHLAALTALDVSTNMLEGTVPGSLCNLQRLQVMFYKHNMLSGNLPYCLFNYTMLRMFDGSGNRFTGSLPSTVIDRVYGYRPRSGSEPSELRNVTYNQQLGPGENIAFSFTKTPITFNLSNNYLSGKIPASLGNSKRIVILSLRNNSLSGNIPPSLGNLSSLNFLDLSFNQLHGTIPSELTNLYALSRLNLSFNDLEGQIPETNQFLTFSELSFLGNVRLCGRALNTTCTRASNGSSNSWSKSAPSTDFTILSIPAIALIVGFALGFLATGATIVFVDKARHYLFTVLRLPYPRRDYNRTYGLFNHRKVLQVSRKNVVHPRSSSSR